MEQDYVPYKYENVIYLVRGENPLPQAEQNTEAFAQLMHKKDLGYLPAVWGSNASHMEEPLVKVSVKCELMQTEEGLCIVFEEPIDGDAVAMIGISAPEMPEDEKERYVTLIMPSQIASEGEVHFSFACKGSEYLIPVCCSPYFTEEAKISYLEVVAEGWEEIAAEQIEVQCYTW